MSYTILVKDDLVSFFVLVEPFSDNPFTTHAILKVDPRQEPFVKEFTSKQQATAALSQAVEMSCERGWEIAYQGPRLLG